MSLPLPHGHHARQWIFLCLPVAWLGSLLTAGAWTWQLALPESIEPVPVADVTDWTQPGVKGCLVASHDSLRNPEHNDALVEMPIPLPAGGFGDAGDLHLEIAMRGAPEQAVWVSFGADNVYTNGQLDGIESLLAVGLDRGRWGLRPRAMGEPLWSPAVMPANDDPCRVCLSIDARNARIRSIVVSDAAGRRTPESFTRFNPGWQDLPRETLMAWERVRIEVRGAGAELTSLSIFHSHPAILIVR